MGYHNEWWPPFSHWNGHQRSVDHSLEWRLAEAEEDSVEWVGLGLLPSPFTGEMPNVIFLGRWLGAPPYQPEWLGIRSYLVNSLGWTSALTMRDAWNRRPSEIPHD